ncbi:MAG TPA: class D sortase [Bacillales bacterium]|nr:class D sortase [Bacillales bacterium]
MVWGKRSKLSFTKIFSLLLLLGGSVFLVLGITGIWTQHVSVGKSLQEAKTITMVNSPRPKAEIETTVDTFVPKIGQVLGLISLPNDKKLPIIQGTETPQLKKGVGHYSKSSFPGQGSQVILSGHRDTVFSHLGELKKGDQIRVKLPYGSFTYTVDHTTIVMADNQEVIHPTDREELVLTTCYPFYYIGNAPKRYIVYAYPVKD